MPTTGHSTHPAPDSALTSFSRLCASIRQLAVPFLCVYRLPVDFRCLAHQSRISSRCSSGTEQFETRTCSHLVPYRIVTSDTSPRSSDLCGVTVLTDPLFRRILVSCSVSNLGWLVVPVSISRYPSPDSFSFPDRVWSLSFRVDTYCTSTYGISSSRISCSCTAKILKVFHANSAGAGAKITIAHPECRHSCT